MDILGGLRLNCRLVPGIQLALGIGVLVMALVVADLRHRQNLDAAALDQVCCGAATALDPAVLRRVDPAWRFAAVLSYGPEDHIRSDASDGTPTALRLDDPSPDLVAGFVRSHHWRRGGTLCVAGPLPVGDDGQRRVLYAERLAPTAGLEDLLIGGLVVLVVVGGLLALYASRHLYRPVEALCEEATAALEGRPARTHLLSSPETSPLAASISALSERVRQSVSGDAPAKGGGSDDEDGG